MRFDKIILATWNEDKTDYVGFKEMNFPSEDELLILRLSGFAARGNCSRDDDGVTPEVTIEWWVASITDTTNWHKRKSNMKALTSRNQSINKSVS